MIILHRIQVIYCFSDSQSRSRFVQIEQIRRRHIKSYAAGGEKCNEKDGEEKRLCAPCESGIKLSSLYQALSSFKSLVRTKVYLRYSISRTITNGL